MDLDRLSSLPISVNDTTFTALESATSSGFTRVSTVVHLVGSRRVGRGEDVTYDPEAHASLAASPPAVPLAYEGTLESYLEMLDGVDLAPEVDDPSVARYRRWALESAALDLALRQAETDLASALDTSYAPVRFVASTRLGDPPTATRLEALRRANPDVGIKLDPTSDWTPDLVEAIAAFGGVEIIDLKGAYEGTSVDQPADPELYELVISAFPEAIIEDPAVTEATRPLLVDEADRISWDAPIASVADVEEQPIEPGWINLKPSRLGGLEAVSEVLRYCRAHDVGLYGGGQFELGVGRGQIQALASIWYPDGPNDVAPRAYNEPVLRDELPRSPLEPPGEPRGFGWVEGGTTPP